MADQEAPVIEAPDTPKDFAAMALQSLTTDADTPTPKKEAPVKEATPPTKTEAKTNPLDVVFGDAGKKSDDAPEKKDEPAESVLKEIAKPELKNPKASEQWDKLHSKAAELEKQAREAGGKLAEMEKKIADYEAKGKNAAELEEKLTKLQKEHEESKKLVQQVNIELDPEFRRQFVDGRKDLIGQARTIVEESGGNAGDIETALNLTGKSRVDALRAIAEGMSSFEQGRLGRVIDALTDLDKTASERRSNPEQFLAQRQQEEQTRNAKATEDRARNMNLSFEEALGNASKGIEVLRKVEGMPEWNERADAIMRRAKENWNGQLDMKDAASKFIAAEAMPEFRQLFLEQRKEASSWKEKYETASKELEAIHANRPGMRTRTTAAAAGNNMTFADRVVGTMDGSIPAPQQ